MAPFLYVNVLRYAACSHKLKEVIAELEHIHAGKNLSVLDALSVNNDTTDLEEDFILDKVRYADIFVRVAYSSRIA